MTLTLDDFGHGTLTMDGVAASGRRPLLTILVRYFNGTVDLLTQSNFIKTCYGQIRSARRRMDPLPTSPM